MIMPRSRQISVSSPLLSRYLDKPFGIWYSVSSVEVSRIRLTRRWASSLFYAFRMQPDTFILTFVFRYLVSYIWFAPALYFYLQLPLAVDLTAIPPELPALLGRVAACGLAAVIPAVLCSLPWCLTVFVLLDDPDCSPAEALRTSRILMQGQYLRVLRLWLGFLPLYLLSLTSMGIGLLWVRPYFYVSMGHLYLELRGDRAEVC